MVFHLTTLFFARLLPAMSFFLATASLTHAQEMRWFAGDTHVHTAIHAVSSISERVEEAEKGGLDWVAITRHVRSGAFWKAEEVDSARIRHAPRVIPVLGMEWDEPPELGLEDIIVLGVNRYAPIPDHSLQAIIDYANREGGVFIFAHPSPVVFEQMRRWTGYTAFEGYSGAQWNAACDPGGAWDRVLTGGTKLFIVGASDNHNDPFLGERIVKTWVMAPGNRPEDIIAGIRDGRVYVSEKDQIQMDFRINDGLPGETVRVSGTGVKVMIQAESKQPLSRLTLVGAGSVVWESKPETRRFSFQETIELPEATGYLRLIAEAGKTRAMSNPVFIDRQGASEKTTAQTEPHPLDRWRTHAASGPEAVRETAAFLMSLVRDSDPDRRMLGAYGLMDIRLPEARTALRQLAGDSVATVRAYAARMLAMGATPEDMPVLRPLLEDGDAQVRLWAVRAAQSSRSTDTRAVLMKSLDDSAYWVHYAAMEGLLDLAEQDSSIFDELLTRVEGGNLNAAEAFNWAPEPLKQKVVVQLREQYRRKQMADWYRALERLGSSPAADYRTTVPATRATPVIDGRMDEALWQNRTTGIILKSDDGSSNGVSEASARIAHTEDGFYVAFHSNRSMTAAYQEMEYILLGFDTNQNGGIDYTFEIDRNGKVSGQKDGNANWPVPVDIRISASPSGWTAEILIPYASLEWNGPVEGKTWGFNVAYGLRGQNTRLSSWAPTLGQPSNARRYGLITFENR